MKTKKDITQWLKESGKNRTWLAEKCMVSYKHLNNWFSKNGKIPAAKLALIEALIKETSLKNPPQKKPYEFPNTEELGKITVTLPDDLQDLVYAEAARLNIKANVYCSLAVEWCATTEAGREAVEELLRQIQGEDYSAPSSPSMEYDESASTLSKINTKPSIKLSAAEISRIAEQAAMEAVANNPPIIKQPARQPQNTPGVPKKSPK